MKRKLYMVLGVTAATLVMGCGFPGGGGDDDDDDDFTQVPQVIAAAGYITPNAHCTTRGERAQAANGITYTCKTTSLNNQLRWRP